MHIKFRNKNALFYLLFNVLIEYNLYKFSYCVLEKFTRTKVSNTTKKEERKKDMNL